MTLIYEEKQTNHFMLIAAFVFLGVFAFLFSSSEFEMEMIVAFIAPIVLFIFSTMKTEIDQEFIKVKFTIIPVKKVKLSEISSAEIIKIPWYHGYGIRFTIHGTLYRLSGKDAIKIELKNKKSFCVGTTNKDYLLEIIKQNIS